jgi:curved DNA-binding protein CbpA
MLLLLRKRRIRTCLLRRLYSTNNRHSDPFIVLGVSRIASADEVRQRYYKLAKELHPDMNKDNQNEEANRVRFTILTDAFKKCYSFARSKPKINMINNVSNAFNHLYVRKDDKYIFNNFSFQETDEVIHDVIQSLQTINVDGIDMTQSGPDWGGDWYQAKMMEKMIIPDQSNDEAYTKRRPNANGSRRNRIKK